MKDAPSTDAVSYGLARPDQIATLTGLEQLQAMLRGELPAPTICRALDFILTEAGDGWAEFRGTPSGDMLNPIVPLIAHMSTQFTLLPGDVVLTGTPKGVGPLVSGQTLSLELEDVLFVETTVV